MSPTPPTSNLRTWQTKAVLKRILVVPSKVNLKHPTYPAFAWGRGRQQKLWFEAKKQTVLRLVEHALWFFVGEHVDFAS